MNVYLRISNTLIHSLNIQYEYKCFSHISFKEINQMQLPSFKRKTRTFQNEHPIESTLYQAVRFTQSWFQFWKNTNHWWPRYGWIIYLSFQSEFGELSNIKHDSKSHTVYANRSVDQNWPSVRRLQVNIFSNAPKHKLVLLEAVGGI